MPHLVFRVETPYPENPDEIDGPSASMEVIKKTEKVRKWHKNARTGAISRRNFMAGIFWMPYI